MSHSFEVLTDPQWELINSCLQQVQLPKVRGRARVDFRKVFNSILYVLITGCRWKDIPIHPQFSSKSTSHLWLKKFRKWQLFDYIFLQLLKRADFRGKIDWDQLSVDSTFSPRIRRRRTD